MLLNKFHELATTIRRAQKSDFQGRVLAFDPGETTGWAVFNRTPDTTELIDAGQATTWPLRVGVENFITLFQQFRPTIIVYESYHIYSWKANQHKNSEVATIQVVGCLQTLAIQRILPYTAQTAQVGKAFCNDQKLKDWGLWVPGLKHARDACRHACYYILFGEPNTQIH
jgi:hypothetical protein